MVRMNFIIRTDQAEELTVNFISIETVLIRSISFVLAEWRAVPKRVTAEYGSDLSLSCTFQNQDSDDTVNRRSLLPFHIRNKMFLDRSMVISKCN